MKKRIYDILLVLLAGLMIFQYSRKPIYNWDMIPYMGVALEYSEHDIHKLHDHVYTILKREIPNSVYKTLTAKIEDRYDCLVNDKAFEDELGYFRVKPLYTIMVYALYKAGVHLVTATLIPSYLASFFILIVLYSWLSKYIQKPLALIATLLLGLYPPFREIAELSSPDAMSNLFILLSLYLAANKKMDYRLVVSLVLTVICRVDNFIFAGVLVYFTYLRDRKNTNLIIKSALIGLVAVAGILFIPILAGDRPDWFMKFAYTASLQQYMHHWSDVLYIFRHSVYDIAMAVIAVVLLTRTGSITRRTAIVVCASVVLHMILFPSLQERFLVAYEFALMIILVRYINERYAASIPAGITKHAPVE